MKLLLLFTQSYPFSCSQEDTFLKREIVSLSKVFDRVIIIPTKTEGTIECLPDNVEYESDFSKTIKNLYNKRFIYAMKSLLQKSFWIDAFKNFKTIFRGKALRRLIEFTSLSMCTASWIKNFFANNQHFKSYDIILYTYWLTGITHGINQSKLLLKNAVTISRAHGIDLYWNRWIPEYQPGWTCVFNNLDALYCISQHGKNYIENKNISKPDLIHLSRIGVNIDMQNNILKEPDKYKLKVVSCSSLSSVKRVNLIYDSLLHASKHVEIEWHHFGDGAEFRNLENLVKTSNENLNVKLHGFLNHYKLLEYYKNIFFDLFINLSSSEGLPVSLMEAMSAGIPAIVTDAGGMPELVSDKCGYVVSHNPSAEEVAETIINYNKLSYSLKIKLRIMAQENTKKLCDEKKNSMEFCNSLVELQKSIKYLSR
jgi:glycosyltransferase involved in cell wall biosynthesis